MPPKLEKVFTLRGYLDPKGIIDTGPLRGKDGPRQIIAPIPSGYLEGSEVRAELLPGSGDWQTLNTSTNVAHLDVRLQFRLTTPRPTDASTGPYSIHMHYDGILTMDEKAGNVLSFAPDAKSTEFGDHYWFSSPMMTTSCPELKWIESSWFVGRGRFQVDERGTAIEYEIYKMGN